MPMSKQSPAEADIGQLLAGAARTIAAVRYCWLATGDGHGGVTSRPMGRIMPPAGADDWSLRFVTDGRSRKAECIRRNANVGLIFQHDPSEAFVELAGDAALLDAAEDTQRLWKEAYGAYFPTREDRANVAFVEIAVQRMQLWIRNVTPEPFGLRPTVLERTAQGDWRLASPVN